MKSKTRVPKSRLGRMANLTTWGGSLEDWQHVEHEGHSDTRRKKNPCRLKTDFDVGLVQWKDSEHKVSTKQDLMEGRASSNDIRSHASHASR